MHQFAIKHAPIYDENLTNLKKIIFNLHNIVSDNNYYLI